MELSLFWTAALTYPAVFFTIPLGILLIYWLLVILGTLDLDLLPDLEHGPGHWPAVLGLSEGVPVMIVVSLLVFSGWLISMPATAWLVLSLPGTGLQMLAGTGVLAVAGFLALWLTAALSWPLRRLFSQDTSHARERLEGKMCTITTSRVDSKFGQAQYEDGGAGLILSVRYARVPGHARVPGAEAPNLLTKGSKAVILAYNAEDNTYWVTALEDILRDDRPDTL